MTLNFDKLAFVVFDFDGVFTDNRVIVSQDGIESVICNRADGFGISRLRKTGVDMMILSTEKVPVVQMRAKKLNLACIHGCDDKLSTLKDLVASRGLTMGQVAFVGNDINDIECLKVVGYPICVNDAYPEVKEVSKLILKKNGGDGAVRELCDMVAKQKEDADAK